MVCCSQQPLHGVVGKCADESRGVGEEVAGMGNEGLDGGVREAESVEDKKVGNGGRGNAGSEKISDNDVHGDEEGSVKGVEGSMQ